MAWTYAKHVFGEELRLEMSTPPCGQSEVEKSETCAAPGSYEMKVSKSLNCTTNSGS